MGHLHVPKGTKCHVRRADGSEWTPFVTTRDLTFSRHGVADNGGTWTFESGGWMMKVATCFVRGRDPKRRDERRAFGAFDKGRGVSRRRNMRAAKRR